MLRPKMDRDPPLQPEVPVPASDHSSSIPAGDDASSAPADAFTRLLEELARTPEAQIAEAWQTMLSPGEVVGRFELVREVGRGGFGVVYEARDLQLGRRVAFKALRPGRALSAAQVLGLRREAEAAAQLNHPNVVTVHDFGSCPAGPFLILELLRGAPLSQRLESGPLPPREAVRIAIDVARALVHAHAAGVIHRDLKPGNVFLCEDGKAKVLDFGLAHLLGARGTRGGTPGYMAPEQCRGETEGERTDLFGLGVLLYRMLTAQMPFEVKEGRSAVLDEGPSPAPSGKHIPPRLSALGGRLLARDPARRPASALEVLDELTQFGWRLDPLALARRHRRRLLAVALVVLAAAGGTAAGLWMQLASSRGRDHVTVAVADFVNETGDPDLEGLSGMLITSLEQSKKLNVLTRSRMRDELKQMGRADAPRIDESLAREIGRRLGTKTLLLASIKRFDSTYAIEMRGLDPVKDRYLFAVSERAPSKAQVPDLLDRVSMRARRELRERSEDIAGNQVQMGEAVTRSLEAYRHYFLGLECIERPRGQVETDACLPHFQAAVAVDPAFATAHYQLASLASTLNLSGSVKSDHEFVASHIGAALQHAGQVPAKERALIAALKARLDGDGDAAMDRYREILARYPDDKHVQYLAGLLMEERGDRAAAIPYFEKAVALDLFFDNAVRSLVNCLGLLQRQDALRALLARWSRLPPNPAIRAAMVRGSFWLGDVDAALQAAHRNLSEAPDAAAFADLAAVQFSRGEFGDTERTLQRALRSFPDNRRLVLFMVWTLSAQGRQREALDSLDGLRSAFPEGEVWDYHRSRANLLAAGLAPGPVWEEARQARELDEEVAGTLAADLALLGDVPHARDLAAHLRPRTPDRELADAVLAWRSGDDTDARSRLRALDALEPMPDWSMPPTFVLAEIASATGNDIEVLEAVARFRKLWNHMGSRGGWIVPRALLLEARAQARLGRVEAARASLDHLLAERSHADRGDALVAEARTVRATLVPGSSASEAPH